MSEAIIVDDVHKMFRLYREKNQYLKSTVLRGRRARYEEFWALKGVSFSVPEGSTFGIIGANGSGKSTLLKCLAGILQPDRGKRTVNGRLSALLELGAGFHPDLSGRENIFLNGAILGMTSAEIQNCFDDIVEFSGLGRFIDTPVKNYSSGMVVRLGFAIAINVEPEIMLIDEVLAVGDAAFQNRCYEKIEEFRQDGRTIVFVSHGLSEVLKLCKTSVWLENGLVKEIGPSANVIMRYSGQSHAARPHDDDEIGERWGHGGGSIQFVELIDREGNPSRILRTRQPTTIRVVVRAEDTIPTAVIGIRISHLHGTVVWGCNTQRRDLRPTLDPGTAVVDIEIPTFPLLEGTYDLTVAFSDETEVHEFDHWEKRVRFDVVQDGVFEEGLITIDSDWRVTQTAQQLR
jgi:ABC-2 type transport system ATP-binding protein